MICRKLESCVISELSGKTFLECSNSKMKCIESSDKRSAVRCEEKRKKYVFENTLQSHVISYKMDGGIIVLDASVPGGTSKCDYLYVVDMAERAAILTELKGVDVGTALKQIYGTLLLYQDCLKKFSHVYGRIIVTSSTPNLKATPDYVNLVKLIRKTSVT